VVLRARRSCITQHRSLSTALSLTMHVGATPSGPEPSGKNSNIFTVNWKRTDLSCAGAPISHFSSLRRNRMRVFGKRVQVHWAWGQQCTSMSLAFDLLNACTNALLAVRGAPFAKGFSPCNPLSERHFLRGISPGTIFPLPRNILPGGEHSETVSIFDGFYDGSLQSLCGQQTYPIQVDF
jgi:hypothetical protein